MDAGMDSRSCAMFKTASHDRSQQKNNPVGFGAQEKNPQNLKPIHLPDRVDFRLYSFCRLRGNSKKRKLAKIFLRVDTM
jgi:hypothetical protein